MIPYSNHEPLEVVDEDNRVIGVKKRSEIHREHLRHRSVHMFIFNARGDLYLQKRSPGKDQYPEHWDSSAAGHPNPGETSSEAAHRELDEELGIATELTAVYRHPACPETGWEFVTLFTGSFDGPLHLNLEEATEGRYFTPAEVEALLIDPTRKVAPGFRLLYRSYQRNQRI
ncbi:MAG: NUDIX domain-containing protein [Deltaproteobacteria bacterium]|nr:NUDIX domain-containing protein [Deltaproteobacteria bacterium]